jgi:predicted nucleotidyltransferase
MVPIAQIREYARKIAEEFRPERIVLFGSHACGDASGDSDVDLLVVMPHEGKGWRRAAEITERLRPDFPIDLLVRSREELDRRLSMDEWFLREICEKGRVLYEAPHP